MSGQEVATRQAPPTLASLITAIGPEIQRALPAHMSGERIARIALTLIRKNPALADCDPNSFLGALLTSAALGLEPGVNNESHLVPYKGKVELIVGYGGVVKLFWNHPLAKRVSAEYVRERDQFSYDKGLTQTLSHTPATGDRGPIIGYYAVVELNTGAIGFDFFTPDQIKALRGGKVGPSGSIADSEHWMERKTALKQVLKLMPKSVELIQALSVDETVGSMAIGRALTIQEPLPQIERADDDTPPDEQGTLA